MSGQGEQALTMQSSTPAQHKMLCLQIFLGAVTTMLICGSFFRVQSSTMSSSSPAIVDLDEVSTSVLAVAPSFLIKERRMILSLQYLDPKTVTPRVHGNPSTDFINDQLPIITSKARGGGFRPVYVYSNINMHSIRAHSRSHIGQDKLILALMKANDEAGMNANRIPYFVDLASNDAIRKSNTLLLEQNGWEGLCMEPNPIYWYGLASLRRCTVVGAFVGGEEDGKEINVRLSTGVSGGIVEDGITSPQNANKAAEEKRNVVSITTVFKETNVPEVIDYLSLDVEGAESFVMQSFPWDHYKFKFMTIEGVKEDLSLKLNEQGYFMALQFAKRGGETLWANGELVGLSKEAITMIARDVGVVMMD